MTLCTPPCLHQDYCAYYGCPFERDPSHQFKSDASTSRPEAVAKSAAYLAYARDRNGIGLGVGCSTDAGGVQDRSESTPPPIQRAA
jgi:hypothetical protein